MWNIPPIVGQKVMLDPSYTHYSDFNRAQARGKDGYILSVSGMNLLKWLLGASDPAVTVRWESGHENSYELKALLPIDSFKTIERVEFMGGNFLNVVDEKSRDYIAERVIMKNDDVKHYSFFDKEKRLDILRKAEATFQALDESNQNKESVQMKYMSILEEIERTKRAEEVVLFLESEGDDVPTPKKHQEVVQHSSSDLLSTRLITDLMGRTVGVVDADFLNPCAEVEMLHPVGLNPFQLGEVTMSPHMAQMARLGAESRARSEAEKQRLIHMAEAFRMDFEIDED